MKARLFKSITAIIFLFTICALNVHAQITYTQYKLPEGNIVFKTATDSGIIYDSKYVSNSEFHKMIVYGQWKFSFFTPNIKLVVKVDSALHGYLSDTTIPIQWFLEYSKKCIANNYSHYIKDYVGYIDSSDRKVLYINCYCNRNYTLRSIRKPSIWWVDDGGYCYFNVSYDLTKNTFYDLRINGPYAIDPNGTSKGELIPTKEPQPIIIK